MTHSVTENEAGEEVNKSVPDASNPGNEAQVDEESTERANQTSNTFKISFESMTNQFIFLS